MLTLLMGLLITSESFCTPGRRVGFFVLSLQAYAFLVVRAEGILAHGGRDHVLVTSVAEN